MYNKVFVYTTKLNNKIVKFVIKLLQFFTLR